MKRTLCMAGLSLLVGTGSPAYGGEGEWQLLPVEKVQPPFPPAALAACLSGEAVAEFGLSLDGAPVGLEIVSSRPEGVFDDAVYAALRRWKFEPPRPMDAIGRRYRLPMRFEAPADCRPVPPGERHDAPAQLPCLAGKIRLNFIVTETGEVDELTIVESSAPVEQDAAVLAHVREMQFEQRVVDGVAKRRRANLALDGERSCDRK